MKKIFLGLVLWNMSFCLEAKEYTKKYFNGAFGHLHLKPYQQAVSETSIPCAFPLKVFKNQKHKFKEWQFVQAGDSKGYVQSKYLSLDRPKCFQAKYKIFYNQMDLSLADIYYWARISDRAVEIRTSLKEKE